MTADMNPKFRARILSRQPIHCPIAYTDGIFCATGLVEDLTSVGARVRGTQPVRTQMKLVVFLIPPGGDATLLIRRGTVRWVDGETFGIDLVEVSPASHTELSRLAAVYFPGLWSNLN
ncbi:MAG: hypothetical protein AB7G68_05930 [Nitrospiraceae bacterium]